MLQDENKVLEDVIVTKHEMKVIDALLSGECKLKTIAEHSGYSQKTTLPILKELREMGWMTWDDKKSTYALNEGYTFRVVQIRNGEVVENDHDAIKNRVPIKATFKRKQEHFYKSNLVVHKWTSEQIDEHEKSLMRNRKYVELKKGVLEFNENFNPVYHSR